jgi:alpha-tubulin suppressor-like RCC1 family protein
VTFNIEYYILKVLADSIESGSTHVQTESSDAKVVTSTAAANPDGTTGLYVENSSAVSSITVVDGNEEFTYTSALPADSVVGFSWTEPPDITSLAVSPTTLASSGGSVTLSADVVDASTCEFSSTPGIAGLPASVGCSTGTANETVTIPANSTASAVTYTFALSATGATTVNGSTVTVTVTGASSVPAGDLSDVKSAVSGGDTECAVLSTGGVDCWGGNAYGEVGNGTIGYLDGIYYYDTPQSVSVITNAVSLSSSGDSWCAVLSTGDVECWGYNDVGEVGNGTIGSPDGADGGYGTPQEVSGISNAVSLASDDEGYCAVLSNGGVDCWGDNLVGELGDGTVGGPDGCASNENSCADTPQAVSGITDAVSLSSDHDESYCAVLSSGSVECWGRNDDGELGNGTIGGPDSIDGYGDGENLYGYDTPQVTTGNTNAVRVSSGLQADGYCAVLSTGGIDCWGYNGDGELGNGSVNGPDGNGNDSDTPQSVTGIANAVSLSAGQLGYCAMLSTGGVECWGWNPDGELGNGTVGGPDGSANAGYDTPQEVTGLTDAVSIANDGLSYCAMLSTGGIDCWGNNGEGELGNGKFDGPDGQYGYATDYDTPQMVLNMTEAVSISDDGYGYCAVLSNGGLDCWGDNSSGTLGNGSIDGIGGATDYGYDTVQAVLAPD